MRTKPYRILLLIAWSSTLSACPKKEPSSSSPPVTPYAYGYAPNRPWGSLDIWATMLVRRPKDVESDVGYTHRLENNANLVRQTFGSINRFWSFFALNETYYDGTVDGHHKASAIPCRRIGGGLLQTAHCYDAHLRDSSARNDLANTLGSVAFLANKDQLTLMPGALRERYLTPYTFLGIGGALSYPLTGGRMKLIGSSNPELIVPLYSVKLPTRESSGENRMSQLADMIGHIKDVWWVPGDMTPVVVGDMNFAHAGNTINGVPDGASDNLAQVMRQHFVEAGMVVGGASIEAVWIGKEESFPGARGTMAVLERQLLPQFNDIANPNDANDTGTLSDHPALFARLQARPWSFSQILNASPSVLASDGPRLYAGANRLYLGWSERTAERNIMLTDSTPASPATFDAPWKLYAPGSNDPIGSNYSPALARFNNRYVIAWTGKGHNKVNVMSQEQIIPISTGWDHHQRFEYTSDDGPVLLAAGSKMILAWKEQGSTRVLLSSSSDGDVWSTPRVVNIQAIGVPAFAYYRDRVVMAWAAAEGRLCVQSSADHGATWANYVELQDAFSPAAPALLAVHKQDQLQIGDPQDSLYLVWSGKIDRHLRIMASPDGVDWSHAKRVLDRKSSFNPSLAYFNFQFVVGWTDDDSNGFVGVQGTPINGDVSIDRVF